MPISCDKPCGLLLLFTSLKRYLPGPLFSFFDSTSYFRCPHLEETQLSHCYCLSQDVQEISGCSACDNSTNLSVIFFCAFFSFSRYPSSLERSMLPITLTFATVSSFINLELQFPSLIRYHMPLICQYSSQFLIYHGVSLFSKNDYGFWKYIFYFIYMDLRKVREAIKCAPYMFLYREQMYFLCFPEKCRIT